MRVADRSQPDACRRSLLLVASLLSLLWLAPQRALALSLAQENFELASNGTNYTVVGEHGTSDPFLDQFFKRGTNGDFSMPVDLLNLHGSNFWAGEDTDFDGPGECRVTVNLQDVRGFQNLRVAWALATGRDAAYGGSPFESTDYMILQTALDGGAWTNVSVFRGPASSGFLREDTNKDGVGDGTQLTRTFQDFQYAVGGVGTGLHVRALLYMSSPDEEAAFDDIRITGDAIPPILTITNPPADIAVVEAVSNFTVQGTANLGVVWMIAWTNGLTGAQGTIPAATNWNIPDVALGVGNNTITVTGSNTVGQTSAKSVAINRVLPPALSITVPPSTLNVPDTTTNLNLAGVANTFVVGSLRWTNSLTTLTGTAPAATNWTITGVNLNLGTNVITVTGTNIVQQSASANVSVYRVPLPVLTITNPPNGLAVAHDVTGVAVYGTTSAEAYGLLRWTNSLNGQAGTATALRNWSITNVPIALGTNAIVVTASNIVGRAVTSTVQVYRVDAPIVTITNPPGATAVSDLVTNLAVQGTANGVVGGLLRWTNSLTGAVGSGPAAPAWTLASVPLALGTNTITVTGSNIVNRTASSSVSVYRVPLPVLTITNPPNGLAVAHDVTGVAVYGTTSAEAYGLLRWTNSLNGQAGTAAALRNWSITNVPIALGTNAIVVTTSNIVGRAVTSTVQVYRVDAPIVTITNPPGATAVSDLVTNLAVQGTANGVVGGLLRWTNSLTGAVGSGPAAPAWTLASVPLALGTNTITVTGSNIVNRTASSSVSVYRVPLPVLTITNPPNGMAVAHDVTGVAVYGTTSAEAYGLLRWTNSLNGQAGTATALRNWSITNVPIALGTNAIVVTTSNIVGRAVTSTVQVYRVDAPIVTITNPPTPSAYAQTVTNVTLQGTANGVVGGLLRWTNSLTGGAGTGTPAASWTLASIPLGLGTNAITVTGSNIVNRTASASVSLYRIPDPVIAITDPASPPTVAYGVNSRHVGGTASAVVSGLLSWSNALNGVTGSVATAANWLAPSVPLAPGLNTITVRGTNQAGRATSAQTVVAREGAILLNEVLVNPVGTDAATDREFIELLQVAGGGSANDLTVVAISGNAADRGVVNGRWNLTGLAFGTNGLLLVGDNYPVIPGGTWSNQVSPHTGFGDAGYAPDGLVNTSLSLLLVRNCLPAVFVGADLDAANDGVLDSAPWSELVDCVGWKDGDAGDVVYCGAALAQKADWPDAATRLPTNRVPQDRSAWYNGEIITSGSDTLGRTYNAAAASTNLPPGVQLTPGRPNMPSPTDQDGDSLPNEWEQQYFGGTTNGAPEADPDGDGESNQAEYWAGTNPTNAASYFTIGEMFSTGTVTYVVYTNGDVVTQALLTVESHRLEWASVSNRMYRVHGTPDLVNPFAMIQGSVAATPPLNTYTSALGTNQTYYYQISVMEPVYP